METLGSLCDKLTIVLLKQEHSAEGVRLESLRLQQRQLIDEIDQYLSDALTGHIEKAKITFAANKVFSNKGVELQSFSGSTGEIIFSLAKINCDLWHEQEKVYEFENVPPAEKDVVIKRLAVLNLERNKCIDEINNNLLAMLTK